MNIWNITILENIKKNATTNYLLHKVIVNSHGFQYF